MSIDEQPDKEIKQIKEESNELEESTKDVLDRVSKLIGNVKQELTDDGNNQNTNIDSLKSRVNTILSNLDKLQFDTKKNEDELKKALENKKQLLQDREKIKQQLDIANERTNEQTGKVEMLEKEMNNLRERKPQRDQELESNMNKLKKEIVLKDERIKELQKFKDGEDEEINMQIRQLQEIENQLKKLKTDVTNQGNTIDGSYDTFREKVVEAQGFTETITNTVKNIGDNISSYMWGGGKKKRKIRYHKQNREKLDKLANKWGIRRLKKYKTKQQILGGLTLLVAYKTKSKVFTKKDLLILAKHLNIKYKNIPLKRIIIADINKKTKGFNFKDLY